MNAHTIEVYRRLRAHEYTAKDALSGAKTLVAWQALEDRGLATIKAVAEEENYFDVYGEPEGYTNGYGRAITPEQERADLVWQLESWGCWRVFAEVRCPGCGRSAMLDDASVGMCAGYQDPTSPYENAYVLDFMAMAVAHFENNKGTWI